MGSDKKPRVSIGLPVFNGERYLAKALDSLVAQTFANFEIIISDNGSTDATPDICRRYAARDPRIRYFRSDVNRGAAWNYNRVFELSTGTYFKWITHDDVYAKEYLAECLKALEVDPGVILSYSRLKNIDGDGQELQKKESTLVSGSKRCDERFQDIIDMGYTCEEVLGIVRSSVLKDTRLIGGYADSDRVLLSALGLEGRFHEVPDYLLYRRIHDQSSVAEYPGRHARTLWFDPSAEGRFIFPYWRQLSEYVKVVLRASIAPSEKIKCYGHLLGWVGKNRRHLLGDILLFLKAFILKYAPWTRSLWRRLKRSLSLGGWRSA